MKRTFCGRVFNYRPLDGEWKEVDGQITVFRTESYRQRRPGSTLWKTVLTWTAEDWEGHQATRDTIIEALKALFAKITEEN